jgi:glycosyltransferase involved in cell wall biosynthesis
VHKGENIMKKIFLDFHGRPHSLYDNLVNYPPDGYEFIKGATSFSKLINFSTRNYRFTQGIAKSIDKLIPVSIIYPFFEQYLSLNQDIQFIYSSGHLIFKKIPWVVDLEYSTHISGYNNFFFNGYKKTIEKRLSSEFCKAILPWTESGKKTIVSAFKSKKIQDKVKTIHLAVPKKNFIKKFDNEKIRILFVASQNIPKDFDIKGGKEVFEAFAILNKRYDNLELIVRSFVPLYYRKKFQYPNIRIIDSIIPWIELEKIFISADIFLFPSHNTPGLVLLDAMSYELPVITTDIWANSEIIEDGKTGFLIQKSNKIRYYDENYVPQWSSSEALKIIKNNVDPQIINQIVEVTANLIENSNLRRKLGYSARLEIEKGKFSIENRNKKLKEIFDGI